MSPVPGGDSGQASPRGGHRGSRSNTRIPPSSTLELRSSYPPFVLDSWRLLATLDSPKFRVKGRASGREATRVSFMPGGRLLRLISILETLPFFTAFHPPIGRALDIVPRCIPRSFRRLPEPLSLSLLRLFTNYRALISIPLSSCLVQDLDTNMSRGNELVPQQMP